MRLLAEIASQYSGVAGCGAAEFPIMNFHLATYLHYLIDISALALPCHG